ncbi:MAG TPA: hypothetical protein VEW94_13870, partial [Chloroflexia bacterium]|nr:hypothetical protein [Chloroflexia bacterium]
RVRKRLAERHISLELTPDALEFLGNEGFDPVYGARPLKRVIQHRLLDRLALEMLDGSIKDGDTVLVDVKNGKLTVTAANRASTAIVGVEQDEVGATP